MHARGEFIKSDHDYIGLFSRNDFLPIRPCSEAGDGKVWWMCCVSRGDIAQRTEATVPLGLERRLDAGDQRGGAEKDGSLLRQVVIPTIVVQEPDRCASRNHEQERQQIPADDKVPGKNQGLEKDKIETKQQQKGETDSTHT